MSEPSGLAPPPVLLDTDVFSKVFVQSPRDDTGTAWASALAGRTVVIAVQTEVELRAWPLVEGLGGKAQHRSSGSSRLGSNDPSQ